MNLVVNGKLEMSNIKHLEYDHANGQLQDSSGTMILPLSERDQILSRLRTVCFETQCELVETNMLPVQSLQQVPGRFCFRFFLIFVFLSRMRTWMVNPKVMWQMKVGLTSRVTGAMHSVTSVSWVKVCSFWVACTERRQRCK